MQQAVESRQSAFVWSLLPTAYRSKRRIMQLHRDSNVLSGPFSPICTVNFEPSGVTRTRMNVPPASSLLAIRDGSVLSSAPVSALRWSW